MAELKLDEEGRIPTVKVKQPSAVEGAPPTDALINAYEWSGQEFTEEPSDLAKEILAETKIGKQMAAEELAEKESAAGKKQKNA